MGFWGRRVESARDGLKKMTSYEQVSSVWVWMRDGFDIMRGKGAAAASDAEGESFDEAMSRHGLSEEDIRKSYNTWYLKFISAFIIGVAGMIIGIVKTYQGYWGALLASVGFLAIVVAQMAVSSFWLSKLSRRRFITFNEWLADKSSWWPAMVLPERPVKRVTKKKDDWMGEKRKKGESMVNDNGESS